MSKSHVAITEMINSSASRDLKLKISAHAAMEGFMACEMVLQCTSRNTLCAVTSLAVSFLSTYQRGCQVGAAVVNCLWSSHGTVRLKRGEENGASCVAETCGCTVAGLPASKAVCYCCTEQA